MNKAQENKLILQSQEMHDFWFKSDNPTKPTRAVKFDEIVLNWDQGRFLLRTSYWLGGAAIAIGATFESVRDWAMFWK